MKKVILNRYSLTEDGEALALRLQMPNDDLSQSSSKTTDLSQSSSKSSKCSQDSKPKSKKVKEAKYDRLLHDISSSDSDEDVANSSYNFNSRIQNYSPFKRSETSPYKNEITLDDSDNDLVKEEHYMDFQDEEIKDFKIDEKPEEISLISDDDSDMFSEIGKKEYKSSEFLANGHSSPLKSRGKHTFFTFYKINLVLFCLRPMSFENFKS